MEPAPGLKLCLNKLHFVFTIGLLLGLRTGRLKSNRYSYRKKYFGIGIPVKIPKLTQYEGEEIYFHILDFFFTGNIKVLKKTL